MSDLEESVFQLTEEELQQQLKDTSRVSYIDSKEFCCKEHRLIDRLIFLKDVW